jgi:hypothetical protein
MTHHAMTHHDGRGRRGGVLVAVLVTLAIVAVLVGSALHAATVAAREIRMVSASRRALDLAERALAGAWAPSRRATLLALPLGAIVADTLHDPTAPHDTTVAAVRRIGMALFWVVADARVRTAPHTPLVARRRVGLLIAPHPPAPPPNAALLHAGTIAIGAEAVVSAAPLPGDSCAAPSDSGQGVRTIDDAAASALTAWLDTLLATAPPDASVTLDATRDGELLPAVPLVHVRGSLAVSHQLWRGVLVVDGDLRLGGGADLGGLIVSRGAFTTSGVGNHVAGTVVALAAVAHRVEGDARLYATTCAVRTALAGVAPLAPLSARAWTPNW